MTATLRVVSVPKPVFQQHRAAEAVAQALDQLVGRICVQDAQVGRIQIGDAVHQSTVGRGHVSTVGFQHALDVMPWGDADAGVLCTDRLGHGTEGFNDQAGPVLRRSAVAVGNQSGMLRDARLCPLCTQELPERDATVTQLQERLDELRNSLAEVQQVQPRRAQAVTGISARIVEIRDALASTLGALEAAARSVGEAGPSDITAQRSFVRGRIDAILRSAESSDQEGLDRLRAAQRAAELRVRRLDAELSNDEVREQTMSRLNVIGTYLGEYSRGFEAESADRPIRLDINALTIVVDEEFGPVELTGFGSGANWVCYHVAAHLALHRYFISQNRPVPRFPMLDQPSQAHFQGDLSASADENADRERERVRAMFKVVADFAEAHAGSMQVIIIDHARYADEWFTSHVRYDWHGGEKLIPDSWKQYARKFRGDEGERQQS